MKKQWNLLIILLFVLLIVVVLGIFLNIPRSTKDQFNNISNDQSSVGGLLIHMMSISDLQKSIKNDKFDLSLMTDCSTNRRTCSAWSLIRRDLQPMVFIYPMVNSPNVGIILNAKKSWDLVTTMSNVDSNTMNRSCCENNNGFPLITRWPYDTDSCINDILKYKQFDTDNEYAGYAVYIPTVNNNTELCPLSCAHNDLFCKYNSAGASINTYDMLNMKQCYDGKFNDCYNFKVTTHKDTPQDVKDMAKKFGINPLGYILQSVSSKCTTCKKPYLCVTKNPPSGNENDSHVFEDKQISAYVGTDGLKWNKLFTPDTLDPGVFAATQCKWEKKDLGLWINSVNKYYQEMSNSTYIDNSMPPDKNFYLANPDHPVYLKNEVNIYVDGDSSSSNYQNQNKIFMDSIEGFFYIPTTCEKQLEVLNGIETTDISSSNTYLNANDRCNAFFETMTDDDRRSYEQQKVNDAKDIVINFTNWFNAKYNKNVSMYKADLSSNSFPNKKNIEMAKNKTLNFDKIFTKI